MMEQYLELHQVIMVKCISMDVRPKVLTLSMLNRVACLLGCWVVASYHLRQSTEEKIITINSTTLNDK